MLVRVPGWEDADVLALLTLFRTHLRVYIYASVNGFVEAAHAELPGTPEMVRQLIQQFGVVLSTKNFRSDGKWLAMGSEEGFVRSCCSVVDALRSVVVIQVDGQEIYVHEHLYETMSELLENKIGGGLWLPDELICFFQKAKQYHSLLQSSPEVYFKRIQIWGATDCASISMCVQLIAALRCSSSHVYLALHLAGKSVAETKSKFYALRDMHLREKHRTHRKGVDARRFELMQELFDKAPPAFRAPTVVINSKAPKLWSSDELVMLVDFLVRITKEVQTTGTSELVKKVTETLHLSTCSVESRAEASSDTKAAAAMSSSHTGAKRAEESKPAAVSPASNLPRQRATAEAYVEFVRDMAVHCEWTEKVVFNVLRCMQHSIELYRADKLVAFFHKIAGLTPENDNWDGEDGASDGDADVDDDGLENQSVDSSDNACACDTFGFDRTKKPSKRGKDENYGKRFVLAKKRRFEAKKPSAAKKDDEEEEVEGEDDGDQQSEDANNEPLADSESVSSDEEEEEEEKPHPLQSILDSLDAHIANLQAKQRELIERKEDRERRQYRHMRGEYGTSMDDVQSYLSGA
ncbi:hypothetical protein BBJ28_00004099 [Nothophytophthora sp. Chile5]|nr:hypothetical protein BBJ28_00004099 [Nothophytophthora sp. Chile5]